LLIELSFEYATFTKITNEIKYRVIENFILVLLENFYLLIKKKKKKKKKNKNKRKKKKKEIKIEIKIEVETKNNNNKKIVIIKI